MKEQDHIAERDVTPRKTRYGGITRLGFFGVFIVAVLLAALGNSGGGPGIIVASIIMLPAAAGRYINMGRSPWWSLVILIPLVAILTYIDCFFTPTGGGVKALKGIRGGVFSNRKATPLECRKASISIDKRYFRVQYLPPKARNIVIKIFCIAVALLTPFGILGSLGAIILYALIDSVVFETCSSKVEFSLDDENLLVDQNRGIIGIQKIKKGIPVFMGAKAPEEILSRILDRIPHSNADLYKASRLKYIAIAVTVWLAGLLVGMILTGELG